MTTCRKTLLVLTPKYIDSEWCDLEGVMAQTLSPANRDLRVIPLLKTPCEKPLYVGALTHIDFTTGADLDLAWRQLLTALGAPPPPEPPKEPQPNHWFLPHPYPMPPNFTGRVAERAMLDGWLNTDPAHPLLSHFDQAFQYIQEYNGFFTPGVAVIFLLGLFWKRATEAGALTAAAGSVVVSFLYWKFCPGIPFMNRIGYVFLICLGSAIVVSLMQKSKSKSSSIDVADIDYSTSTAFNTASLAIIAILIALYAIWW